MDPQLTKCSSCGAGNRRDAEWCGQCFQRFDAETTAPDVSPSGWTCRACDAVNDPADGDCATCGSSIFRTFEERNPDVPLRAALRASLVPGWGMARTGRVPEGLLVGVLVVFAVGWGLAVVVAGAPGGWALIAVGALTWIAATRDAAVAAAGGSGDAWLSHRAISIVAALIVIIAAILTLRTPIGGDL